MPKKVAGSTTAQVLPTKRVRNDHRGQQMGILFDKDDSHHEELGRRYPWAVPIFALCADCLYFSFDRCNVSINCLEMIKQISESQKHPGYPIGSLADVIMDAIVNN